MISGNFIGFTGPNCKVDINECQSSPCQNGAPCTEPTLGAYECVCPPGYTGIHCETDLDECASGPCESYETCTDLVNGYQWVGFGLFTVEILPKDVSDYLICVNTFQRLFHKSYQVYCWKVLVVFVLKGIYQKGRRCLKKEFCLDHSFSKIDIKSTFCFFSVLYIPDQFLASFKFNSPVVLPFDVIILMIHTKHKLLYIKRIICNSPLVSSRCSCPEGTTGLQCGELVDKCLSNPCQNSGTCITEAQGYSCTCPYPWAGLNCEIDTDPCLPNPCLAMGTCQVDSTRPRGFRCFCPEGFIGRYSIKLTTEVMVLLHAIDYYSNYHFQCYPCYCSTNLWAKHRHWTSNIIKNTCLVFVLFIL